MVVTWCIKTRKVILYIIMRFLIIVAKCVTIWFLWLGLAIFTVPNRYKSLPIHLTSLRSTQHEKLLDLFRAGCSTECLDIKNASLFFDEPCHYNALEYLILMETTDDIESKKRIRLLIQLGTDLTKCRFIWKHVKDKIYNMKIDPEETSMLRYNVFFSTSLVIRLLRNIETPYSFNKLTT